MKLLTPSVSNNFYMLKILLGIEFSAAEVDVISSKTGDGAYNLKNHSFPKLQLDNGEFLFKGNSICRYLLRKSKKVKLNWKAEEWMEWESSRFQPLVVSILIDAYHNSKTDPSIKKNLCDHLSYLNSFLSAEGNSYLSQQTSPGLEDIIVWSTLYPLATDKKIFQDYLSKQQAIIEWFEQLLAKEMFANVESHVLNGKNPSLFKESLIAAPLPATPYLCSDENDATTVEENASFSEKEIEVAFQNWLQGKRSLPSVKPLIDPILPKKGERNVLVTSALPYVNNVPHLGNIIGSVLSADVFARYCRLQQYNTLYICGTDEYGTATETKALEEGLTPKEICDKYFKVHSEVYRWFNISFNFFGRTTTEQQTKIAQDIFWKLHKNGYLLKDSLEQLYCESCQRFLADRFVEGTCPLCGYEDARGDQCDKCSKLMNAAELKNPQCKLCKSSPIIRTSTHLFLNLPKLEPKLKQWLELSTQNGEWTQTARVISYSWLKEGLKPRCITRDLKWGTPVPLEGLTDKVFYVWFDAPIGYPSITANYTDKWEEWWKQPDDVQLYQFMAKDNVPFHGIIFPSCLLGTGESYTLVSHLAAVEYFNYEDTKFSKSRSIGVFGNDAKDTGIPADIWRFYLLFLRPEGQDTAFNWADLMMKNNTELLNNLGNFINRALMFLAKNFNNHIPEMDLTASEKILILQINKELQQYFNLMERLKLRDAIKPILTISRLGNQHIQANKPWELIKGTEEEKKRAGTVMGLSANIACLLANLLEPYMPDTSSILRKQINCPSDCCVFSAHFTMFLAPGHELGMSFPLFKKIEQSQIEELKKRFGGRQSTPEKKTEVTKVPIIGDNRKIGDAEEIARLTTLVAQQGDKVRQLKLQKAEKDLIDKEVETLLCLKADLAVVSGHNVANSGGSRQKNKQQRK